MIGKMEKTNIVAVVYNRFGKRPHHKCYIHFKLSMNRGISHNWAGSPKWKKYTAGYI